MPNDNDNNNSAYEFPSQNPDNFNRWLPENMQEYKDSVYDRISKLLIEKFSEFKKHIIGKDIKSLQKTYKNGKLVSGKKDQDMLVVYESDIDANSDDNNIETKLFNWLNFADVNQLTLAFIPWADGTEVDSETGLLPLPHLLLSHPNHALPFDMGDAIADLPLSDISLTDNISQFMDIKKVKTDINRSKLSQHISTEFSELSPVTFTHLLERYNKFKKDIPFYRYRTDDFFYEYATTNIPIEYRIEKFFEEFSRIKDQIPAGSLAGISSDTAMDEQGLFGYGTMTYLLYDVRLALNDGSILEWSTTQVQDFMNRIQSLSFESGSLVVNRDYWRDLYNQSLRDLGIAPITDGAPTVYSEATSEIPPDPPWFNITTEGFTTDYNGDGVVDFKDVKLQILAGIPGCPIFGCNDSTAINYDSTVTDDDGTCEYIYGCMDNTSTNGLGVAIGATNYNAAATKAGGLPCEYTYGCIDSTAANFNAQAVKDDGNCVYELSLPYFEYYDPDSSGAIDTTDVTSFQTQQRMAIAAETQAIVDTNLAAPPYMPVGCTDTIATNYDSNAVQDDGSCTYLGGCTDNKATNYNPDAIQDDGSCTYKGGCTDTKSPDYDSTAQFDDGSCTYTGGCTDNRAKNYNSNAQVDNGTCDYYKGCIDPTATNYLTECDFYFCIDDPAVTCTYLWGCTNEMADNYNPNAQRDDGSCTGYHPVAHGCTSPMSCNYDPNANWDDGTCAHGNYQCSNGTFGCDICDICNGVCNAFNTDCTGYFDADSGFTRSQLHFCDCNGNTISGCDNTCGSTLVDDACGLCGGDSSLCGWGRLSSNCVTVGLFNNNCNCTCKNMHTGATVYGGNVDGCGNDSGCETNCRMWCNSKNTYGY